MTVVNFVSRKKTDRFRYVLIEATDEEGAVAEFKRLIGDCDLREAIMYGPGGDYRWLASDDIAQATGHMRHCAVGVLNGEFAYIEHVDPFMKASFDFPIPVSEFLSRENVVFIRAVDLGKFKDLNEAKGLNMSATRAQLKAPASRPMRQGWVVKDRHGLLGSLKEVGRAHMDVVQDGAGGWVWMARLFNYKDIPNELYALNQGGTVRCELYAQKLAEKSIVNQLKAYGTFVGLHVDAKWK